MSLAVERTQPVRSSVYANNSAFTRRLGVIAAAATFLMLLAMTIGTALGARAVLNSQSEQRFSDVVTSASNSVRADLDRSFTEIAALEAFIRAEPEITNDQFQVFASTVSQRSAASEALGFAPSIDGSPESQSFLDELMQQGALSGQQTTLNPGQARFPVAYVSRTNRTGSGPAH